MGKLSKRLSGILSLIQAKPQLWDICCDHGELGFAAVDAGVAQEIYLVDRVPSIIHNLDERIKATDIPLGFAIKTFCEDAAKTKRNFSNANIVISGIGESTAIEILEQYTFDSECELILSIHSDNYELREYLAARGFKLLFEQILKDKGKYYELLRLSLNEGEVLTKVGDSMWSSSNPESIELLEKKISYLETRLRHHNNEQDRLNFEALRTIFLKTTR